MMNGTAAAVPPAPNPCPLWNQEKRGLMGHGPAPRKDERSSGGDQHQHDHHAPGRRGGDHQSVRLGDDKMLIHCHVLENLDSAGRPLDSKRFDERCAAQAEVSANRRSRKERVTAQEFANHCQSVNSDRDSCADALGVGVYSLQLHLKPVSPDQRRRDVFV